MRTKRKLLRIDLLPEPKNGIHLRIEKRMKTSYVFAALLMLFSFNFVSAQDEDIKEDIFNDASKPFSIGAHLENMHLWHGFIVYPGVVIGTNLEYNSRNDKFTFGFWGGASFAGSDVYNPNTGENVSAYYKEFSIYTKYQVSEKFFIEAVSHNNYTGVEERGDELHYWSYDKTQGYNFVDINFGYYITPKTLLYLATIVGGGAGDYQIEADGSLKDSWTQYFEVNSTVWSNKNSNLSLFVGGAWSLFTDTTFYTEGAGNIVNVGATFSRDFTVVKYKVPVAVTAMWNPEQEITVLQLDIALF